MKKWMGNHRTSFPYHSGRTPTAISALAPTIYGTLLVDFSDKNSTNNGVQVLVIESITALLDSSDSDYQVKQCDRSVYRPLDHRTTFSDVQLALGIHRSTCFILWG
uniref:Uncharacterized protein n=1 Tax=Picea sitchensis TaxID=3332 RepID=A0A6B9XWZ7_PICSI|nr:hypothetical protein Q903MT_gene5681 [Picea sitchensis]